MAKLHIVDRATIKLDKIEIKYADDVQDYRADEESKQYGKYPFISYKGMPIESDSISKLKLYNNKFLPYLEMVFVDKTGRIQDDYFPLDDSIISLFLRSHTVKKLPIRMDFKITSFSMSKKTDYENQEYTVGAELNIDGLYIRNWESYKGSSFNVLKTISKELELGFVTNIDDTSDDMTWININNSKSEFIRNITEHSYKSDETFMWSYVDFYYNLNYVEIETQLKEDISRQGNVMAESYVQGEGIDTVQSLTLTNNPDANNPNSNLFIKNYVLLNDTTALNIDLGYKHRIHYYDQTNTNYNSTFLDSISDTDNNSSIVLKGNPERPDSKFSNNVFNQTYLGKMDTDNVHKNYLYAYNQNLNNIKFLQKIKMVVVLNQANFNLYRFQKVNVVLYKMSQIMQGDEEQTQNLDNSQLDKAGERNWKINDRLSGEWLITGINMTFDKDNGSVQEVTMIKRELSLPKYKK